MQLYHRDLGGDGKPPLVILHGLLGSSRNWQTAGRDLAAKYHVYAVDLRNHGSSPHAPTMGYEEMMNDVLQWLGAQRLEKVTLMGHSMGGKVAMLLACRQPQRVEHLIIVDIAPKDYSWAGHRASFAAMNELNLSDLRSRTEAEMRLEGRVPSWSMRKFLTTNLDRTSEGKWQWQINLPVITSALPELERNPLGLDDHYVGSALVVAGETSNYIEAGDHAVIRAHFPAAQIVVLRGVGHNPHLDARPAFVSAVLGS